MSDQHEVKTGTEPWFDALRDFIEGVVSFVEDDAPDELDGSQAGYVLGALHEQGHALLNTLANKRAVFDRHLKEAFDLGFQEGGEAKHFVAEVLVGLSKPDPETHDHTWLNGRYCAGCGKLDRQYQPEYARNADGSYMTPEQSDEGWAVQ